MLALAVVATALAAPKVVADLQTAYPVGRTILVTLTVDNDGSTPLHTPDLSSRPWLVHFVLTDAKAHKQTRGQPAPPTDAGATWDIPPRSRRQVFLEIPGSGGLDAGAWNLSIAIDGLDLPLPSGTFTLRSPGVAAVDSALPTGANDTAIDLWVDGIRPPYQGYLRSAPTARPESEIENHFVMAVDRPVLAPILSAATPGSPWVRHVVWLDGSSLSSVAVTGRGLTDPVRHQDFPWPKVALLGAAATDGAGRLVVPFWLPSPSGQGGVVQVATIARSGRPEFHKVTALPAPPAGVAVIVDSSGGVQLLVRASGSLDRFVVRPDMATGVPVPGSRVLSVPVLDSGFAVVPDIGDEAGGLVVWTLVRETGGFRIDWFGLDGSVKASRSIPSASRGEVLAVLPDFHSPAVATGVAGKGESTVTVSSVGSAFDARVPVDPSRWALYLKTDATVGVRSFDSSGRVTVR